MGTTNFNIRLDTELRDKSFPILESYGLSASQAFKLFLTQVAETHSVPLSFDYASRIPNQLTQKAIREGREDYKKGKLKGYSPNDISGIVSHD